MLAAVGDLCVIPSVSQGLQRDVRIMGVPFCSHRDKVMRFMGALAINMIVMRVTRLILVGMSLGNISPRIAELFRQKRCCPVANRLLVAQLILDHTIHVRSVGDL